MIPYHDTQTGTTDRKARVYSTYLLYSRVSDIVLLIGAVGFGFMMQNFRTEVLSEEQRKLVGKIVYPLFGAFLAGFLAMIGGVVLYVIAPGLFPLTQYISAPVAMLVMFGMIPLIGGVFGYFFRKRCTREGRGGHEIFWGIRRSKKKPRRYGRTSIFLLEAFDLLCGAGHGMPEARAPFEKVRHPSVVSIP